MCIKKFDHITIILISKYLFIVFEIFQFPYCRTVEFYYNNNCRIQVQQCRIICRNIEILQNYLLHAHIRRYCRLHLQQIYTHIQSKLLQRRLSSRTKEFGQIDLCFLTCRSCGIFIYLTFNLQFPCLLSVFSFSRGFSASILVQKKYYLAQFALNRFVAPVYYSQLNSFIATLRRMQLPQFSRRINS